jgi:hypothetical protein
VAQTSVYSRIASATPRGMAPREFEIRYVVVARMGTRRDTAGAGRSWRGFYGNGFAAAPRLTNHADICLFTAARAQQPGVDLIHRYVEAIGGEAALRAVRTRVTTGEFNNGRGL